MMSEERRRSLRTQGRFSTTPSTRLKSSSPRNFSTPSCSDTNPSQNFIENPTLKLPESVPEDIDEQMKSLKITPNQSDTTSSTGIRLTYHETSPISQNIKTTVQNLPPKCQDIRSDSYKRWIDLDTETNLASWAYFDPEFINQKDAKDYLNFFLGSDQISWETKTVKLPFGNTQIPRLTSWYGPASYSYGKIHHNLNNVKWPELLTEIKIKVEEFLYHSGNPKTFNSVLLNLYRDDKDSVGWHSDDELAMGIDPTIASVSFGDTRKFEFKKFDSIEDFPLIRFYLNSGSIIIMDGTVQKHWKHRVPKEYHKRGPRINLTFRTVFASN